MKKIALLIALSLGLFVVNAAEPAQPATAAPAVLLIGPQYPTPIEEYFRSKGWQTLRVSWGKPFETRFLRQFNVIVLAQYPLVDKNARSNSNLAVTPQFEEHARRQLQHFVRDGGGLLTFGGDDPMRDRDVVNAFLKPWDVKVLREQVVDPSHTFTQKNGMNFVYQHTANIEKHPATRDVRGIFYPTTSIYGLIANPLKAGAAWQPLVRGSEQAVTLPIVMDQHNEKVDETRPGSFTTSPLLAAVRQAGDGRVALFGWGPCQTFYQYGHFMVEDIYFTRGGDGKPSDGLKLLEQTLAWLAEPSMTARTADAAQIASESAAVKKISGLSWWLRADVGVKTDGKGNVSAWNDQSRQRLNAKQPEASQQPSFVPNALNGQPAVRFDGTNKTLLSSSATLKNNNTIIVVASLGKTPPKTMVLPSLFSYVDAKGSEAGGARLGVSIMADQRVFVGLRYADSEYWNHSDLAFTPTKPVIMTSRRKDGHADIFINGSFIKTKPVPGEMTTVSRFFRLGQRNTEPVYFSGDIAEVLVFNAALSEGDRAKVEKYLTAKYGITLFGGYKNAPMRKKAVIPDPIVWTAPDLGDKSPEDYWREKTIGAMDATGRWYKGIIGARTKLTGGKGSVAEYAAAARTAKLDFIGFTERVEDISAISKETWDKFRKECLDATGPDLLVLPGQLIQRGEARDWYFRVSDFESPPKREFLTADGKRIMNSLYEHFASGLNTLGPLDIRNQPSPHWVSRNYNSMAVSTTREGKTSLDLEPFLYVTQNLDNPKPVALDLITSPDQVAAASKRFVNLRFARSQEELRKQLKTPDNGNAVQISSGPVITNWQGRNTWRQTFGMNVLGTERALVRLQVKSEQPLAEAIIYDGPMVYRRYKLEGNTCDIFIHSLHDQQHQLVAVVKDVDGGMAVAAQMSTADAFNYRTICSDRQNSLTASYQLSQDGSSLSIAAGIMQSKYANRGVGPVAESHTVGYVPYMWDGSRGAMVSATFAPSMWEAPHILPARDYQKLIGRMEFPLGSRDVMCQAVGYEYISPNEPGHNGGFWPMEPLKTYNAYARIMEFKKTPDQPAASLIEGYYVMLQDGQWDKQEWLWSSFSHMFYTIGGRPSSETVWFFVNPAKGEFLSGAATSPKNAAYFVKSLEPGGYLAYARGMDTTAFFPLDTPVQVKQELSQNIMSTRIGYGRIGESYKKGDIVPFRFVSYIGCPTSVPDNRAIEQFRADVGLSGSAPAYTVIPSSGKVLGSRYVLELQAQDGGFGGVIGKAKLDTRLPIRVHGVNPNWTCGIVERNEKWWLPLGVMDDLKLTSEQQAAPTSYSAYAALDITKDRDVWIGNVVLCDQPELKLTLLPEGDGRFSIEAHNPTTKPVSATITVPDGLWMIKAGSKKIDIPAGASTLIAWSGN
jgi:hypothetical protein